jgi:hypothetical protein
MTVRAARLAALRSLAVGVGAVIVALAVASYSDNVQGYTIDLVYPFVLAGGLATVARSPRVARPHDPRDAPGDAHAGR